MSVQENSLEKNGKLFLQVPFELKDEFRKISKNYSRWDAEKKLWLLQKNTPVNIVEQVLKLEKYEDKSWGRVYKSPVPSVIEAPKYYITDRDEYEDAVLLGTKKPSIKIHTYYKNEEVIDMFKNQKKEQQPTINKSTYFD